jgi:hypothetical protein
MVLDFYFLFFKIYAYTKEPLVLVFKIIIPYFFIIIFNIPNLNLKEHRPISMKFYLLYISYMFHFILIIIIFLLFLFCPIFFSNHIVLLFFIQNQ